MGFIRKTEFPSASFSGLAPTLAITAPNAGDCLILAICTMDNTSGEKLISTITDNGLPATPNWTKGLGFDDTTHGCNVEIWYALEVKGSPTILTLNMTGTGVASSRAACVEERDDIRGRASLVERNASASTSGATVSSGNTGVTSERELAFGIYGDGNQIIKMRVTAEWIERSNSTNAAGNPAAGFVFAERFVDTGVQSVTFDATPTTTFGAVGIATFKLAIGAKATDSLGQFTETPKPTLGAMFNIGFQPNAFQEAGALLSRTATDTIAALTEVATRGSQGFSRVATDTVAALTETPARITTAARTGADTLGALAETATRGAQSLARTASETLGGLTETATRAAQSLVRTSVDTIGTLAETAARKTTAARTASDTLGALTELAVGLKVIIRTATDSLTQLTETATRAAQPFIRTASETLASLAENATRVTNAPRTAVDTLASLTETASRAAMTLVRSATDTVGAFAESVARVAAHPRTATDTLGSLVETTTRQVANSRTVTETLSAFTELVVGLKVIIRTATDSLGQYTETATRSAQAFIRAATETLGAFSEVTARIATASRTVTDSLAAFVEAASAVTGGLQHLVRTATDTLSSLVETTGRQVSNSRTATDALGALTETTTRIVRLSRTAIDTLGGFVETALRAPQSLARAASDVLASLIEAVSQLVQGSVSKGSVSAYDRLANSVLATDAAASSVLALDHLAQSVIGVDVSTGEFNLVANNYGQAGNNSNWSQTLFDNVNQRNGHPSFKITAQTAEIDSDSLMPIDITRPYFIQYWAESTTHAVGAHHYLGLNPYDIDGLAVASQHVMWFPSTTTTLAADLHPGDTTITLTSTVNWINTGTFQSAIIVWDYVDGHGKAWPTQTYSRHALLTAWNAGGISGNVITLRVPWVGFGATIPAGTPVSNGNAGSTYFYAAAVNVDVPATWTQYAAVIPAGYDTTGANPNNRWRQGMTQAKMLILANRDVAGNVLNVTDMILEPVTTGILVESPVSAVDRLAGSVGATDS